MSVAIIIVGFRNAQDIRACVEAVSRSTHRAFAITVCENGGRASYETLLDELGAVCTDIHRTRAVPGPVLEAARGRLAGGQPLSVLLASANLGYAGGINACLADSASDRNWTVAWILNPDAQPEAGSMAALLRKCAGGEYGLVGGCVVLEGTGRVQLYGGRWRAWIARGLNVGRGADPNDRPSEASVEERISYVSGACLAATRSFVDEVGPLDESYFLYNEEVDWCYRRGRFKLGYAHDCVVRHAHGSTLGSSSSRKKRSRLSVYLDERNKLLFTRRFYPGRYPLVVMTTLALTSQYLAEGAPRNFLHALDGWLAGLRGETGHPWWMRAAGEQEAS